MTEGALLVLKQALQDIVNLPQPDGHDCDDDKVIETLSELIEGEMHGFEVWATQGQGGVLDNTYPTLEEALAHVEKHKGEASFGIKYPSGNWHEWGRV